MPEISFKLDLCVSQGKPGKVGLASLLKTYSPY